MACPCVTCLLSPDSQQRRRWQFVRSCPGRISLSLALKNPLRKLTASIDIQSRQFCQVLSHEMSFGPGPYVFREEMETLWLPLSAVKTEGEMSTGPASHCWRLKRGSEDGGRSPLIRVKLRIFTMLCTLNFFPFLEGCNQITMIILWDDLKLRKGF